MPPAAPSRATLRAPALASVMTADRLLIDERLPESAGTRDAVLGANFSTRECLKAGIALD